MGDMTIPLQFASPYNGQEVFMWSDCLLDLGTDFLFGNMVTGRERSQAAGGAVSVDMQLRGGLVGSPFAA